MFKKIIFSLLVVFGLTFFVAVLREEVKNGVVDSPESESLPNDWQRYQNVERSFSLLYPPELVVKEYDEGDGTYTIVFEGKEKKQGFQIFFTPYLGDTITSSRILKDVPGGEFTEPIEILFGKEKIRGLIFFSQQSMGQMREAWFLRDGYLFEVTTRAELDEWLARILSTWRFE